MTDAPAPAAAPRPARRNRLAWWRRLTANPMTLVGMGCLALVLVPALLAPVLPLADPDDTVLSARLTPPFADAGPLGTDHLGRDLLSRLLWGTQVSVAVGVAATLVAALIGGGIGLLAAFYGRWVDMLLMRSIDALMAFPYLLLALAIVAALGPSLMNALLAISIVNIPFFARAVRGQALAIRATDYIAAARLSGMPEWKIIVTEVVPNVVPVIVVTMSTTLSWMILETAGLSFLGLGAQPPTADLGSMLGDGRELIYTAPWVSILPGAVILILAIGINLVGDGVRDLLDPRLKGGALTRPAARTATDLPPAPAGAMPPAAPAPAMVPPGDRADRRAAAGARRAAAGLCLRPALPPGRAGLRRRTDRRAGAGPGAGRPLPADRRPSRRSRAGGTRGGMTTFLTTEGLTKTYRSTRRLPWAARAEVRAVRGVDLAVDRGRSLGLVGESGCGKSTVARMLVGLLPPTGGTIRLDGVPIRTGGFADRAIRGRIQMVFQDPLGSLNPRKTVRQLIEVPLIELLGMDGAARKRRVAELMDMVGLRPEFVDRYPHEVSGGQCQRIGIARALAAEAEILVLDEPVSALDVSIQAQILTMLDDLRTRLGLTFVFISHDLSVISHVCDTVAVMTDGAVVEEGPVDKVLGDPQHAYTRTLLDSVPALARATG